jgi:succinate-semialdehyde dehydrogenase / glutarate-semialdehyde dehydrogenase
VEEKAREKVQSLVDDAVRRGAIAVMGGQRPAGPGFFHNPTVLANVSPDSELMSTEIFGPVAPIIEFDDDEEVMRLANNTPWGLVGYLFTQDLDRAMRFSAELEVGMVGLNTGLVSNPAAPFGGVKQSGLGREGGRVGIEEFLETKYLAIPRR